MQDSRWRDPCGNRKTLRRDVMHLLKAAFQNKFHIMGHTGKSQYKWRVVCSQSAVWTLRAGQEGAQDYP